MQISSLMKVRRPQATNSANLMVEQATSQLNLLDAKVATNRIASIPLWQFVASAAGGASLLPLLFFLLWKVGFFKRHRPQHMEKEKATPAGHDAQEEASSENEFESTEDAIIDHNESFIKGMQFNLRSGHDVNA